MSETDSPLKLLARQYIRDIAGWLLHQEVTEAEELNVELTTEAPRVDLVFRLVLADARACLFHLEFQGRRSQPEMARRQLNHLARLALQHDWPLVLESFVLYVEKYAGSQDTGSYQVSRLDGSLALGWQYTPVHLWRQPAEELLALGRPVSGFESDKVRALLAYLAVEAERPHPRGTLTGLLWPDWPERAARRNLTQALSNLRRAIGDHSAAPSFLLVSHESIQLNSSGDSWVDVTVFTTLLATVEKHPHARLETCATCLHHLQQAVALYRGHFLEGFVVDDSAEFEEWALLKREQLERQMLRAL